MSAIRVPGVSYHLRKKISCLLQRRVFVSSAFLIALGNRVTTRWLLMGKSAAVCLVMSRPALAIGTMSAEVTYLGPCVRNWIEK